MDVQELNQKINENQNIIIDFYADWCTPCKQLEPILEEIEEKYDVNILKINIDENIELAQQYGIVKIPSLFHFENGEKKGECKNLKKKNDVIADLNIS